MVKRCGHHSPLFMDHGFIMGYVNQPLNLDHIDDDPGHFQVMPKIIVIRSQNCQVSELVLTPILMQGRQIDHINSRLLNFDYGPQVSYFLGNFERFFFA